MFAAEFKDRRLDLLGVAIIGTATGLGGGVLRDVLLGALLSGEWDVAEAAADGTRDKASGVVAAYTQWHLERGLRSLQHVDRTVRGGA